MNNEKQIKLTNILLFIGLLVFAIGIASQYRVYLEKQELNENKQVVEPEIHEYDGINLEGVNTSMNIVDSARLEKLLKNFNVVVDEFSTTNTVWYKHKSAPKYRNSNGIFIYFKTEKGKPDPIRFSIQYHAEDWLFFKTVKFNIDGTAYDYKYHINTFTDSKGGYIWEWFDEVVITEREKQLIKALINAKDAKFKLIGDKYEKTKTISDAQIEGIRQTFELYHVLGGLYF